MKFSKQKIYNALPYQLKNLLVTAYNLRFLQSHKDKYKEWIQKYHDVFFNKSNDELKVLQNDRFLELITYVKQNNDYYKELLQNISINSIDDIKKIPILTKDALRNPAIRANIDDKLHKGYTGGTTGKSLEFYLTDDDFIERQACLDFFRGMYGYHFRDEIAWFSGKEIITENEIKKNVFWVRDLLNHISYYSTFHLSHNSIDSMIDNFNHNKPEFFAGFPSAMYDIARRWKSSGKPMNIKIKAIFPTSEPLYEYQKEFLEEFFQCPVPDQYATSEGAPFIYECPEGALHYDMYSGIFELLDPEAEESEVLVTSFTTHYMPLIRYRVGDKVIFDDPKKRCNCGSQMPLVKKIIGRSVAFVYSKERGKITVSNISNVVKYLNVIDKLQLIQNSLDEIMVKVLCPKCDEAKIMQELEYELRYRMGDKIKLTYDFVDDIPSEKNGKYLMIKNTLTDADLEIV